MRAWQTLDRVDTPEGPLELRRRGERDFVITISGRVLMTSSAHRSEDDLARLACAALPELARPRMLVGGMGMGYTLRAALELLPPAAEVTVAELNPQVAAWCRGPLGPLTGQAIADQRVTVEIADVAQVIGAAPAGCYDAIVLDLYEGPHHALNQEQDPFYGAAAVRRAWAALRPGGVLAVWSEAADQPFERRLAAAGFRLERHRCGHGGGLHVVYVAARDGACVPPT